MFETLQAAAADPILGLMARFREDQRAHKVDLGVGVYRDPSGRTPVMRAVHAAERLRLEEEDSKSYQGMLGDVAFDAAIQSLCFGPSEAGIADRLATVHTPGGTAALRTAADLVRAARPDARVWLADPSWDNHAPIFRAAGLEVLMMVRPEREGDQRGGAAVFPGGVLDARDRASGRRRGLCPGRAGA